MWEPILKTTGSSSLEPSNREDALRFLFWVASMMRYLSTAAQKLPNFATTLVDNTPSTPKNRSAKSQVDPWALGQPVKCRLVAPRVELKVEGEPNRQRRRRAATVNRPTKS